MMRAVDGLSSRKIFSPYVLLRALTLSPYSMLSVLALLLCFLLLVDGAIQQLQMSFSGGRVLIGNIEIKIAFLATVALGCIAHPTIKSSKLPLYSWLLCNALLVVDIAYLLVARGLSLESIFFSYWGYYLLLLLGPAAAVFRGTIPEKLITRCVLTLFLVSAVLGAAQYLTVQPILHTESVDGSFYVTSWAFFDQIRAFSLFTSSMNFGLFCSLTGALGIGVSRQRPLGGSLLTLVAALACFTTLTRLCYLVFGCACTYALILTYGKKATRGLWAPLVFFALGICTILAGLFSLVGGNSNLGDSASLIDRLEQWAYYSDLLMHSSWVSRLLGLGIVQNDRVLPLFPMVIDSMPLALVLHIGLVGFVIFGILLVKMWLYLRREALSTQQPFIIAAASVWATFLCAGTFNILFNMLGTLFVLVLLCKKATLRQL